MIMTPTELKMQPTIHLQSKSGPGRGQNPGLQCQCIVGCIFNSVGLIITREILCIDNRYFVYVFITYDTNNYCKQQPYHVGLPVPV
jgi:hypothetical protein